MTTKARILFVDDNTNLLSSIRRVMRGRNELLTAEGAADALQILATDNAIAVVISDQNMPSMKGIEFLAKVAQKWPLVVRIMQTGNSDQETAIEAINAGHVFKFIRKPYEPEKLLLLIDEAIAHHKILVAERHLLETTLAGSIKLLTELLSQLRPGLFAQAMEVHAIGRAVAKEISIPNAWELDIASLLYPLGLITLNANLQSKLASNLPLTVTEKKAFDESAGTAAGLMRNIPKLEHVAQYVSLSRKGFDGSGYPSDGPRGEEIPIIARLLRISIDIAYLSSVKKISAIQAGKELMTASSPYDPDLLGKVVAILTMEAATSNENAKKMQLDVTKLHNGDQIISDVSSKDGKLLLKKGMSLSDLTINRLHGLVDNEEIEDSFHILRVV